MTVKEEKQMKARQKKQDELQEKHDAALIEMQKAFTMLATNYAGMVDRFNKLLDKCEPLIDGAIERFKKES